MDRIRYVLKDKDDALHNLDIELIDSEYVDIWQQTLRKVCAELNFGWSFAEGGNSISDFHTKSPEFIDNINSQKKACLGELITAYEYLIKVENAGMSSWSTAPDAFFADTLLLLEKLYDDLGKVRQHHLNDWHRHFTTLEVRNQPKRLHEGDENCRKHYFYIHEINRIVHNLEFFIPQTERKIKYSDIYFSINFSNANNNSLVKMDDCAKVWNYCTLLEPGIFDFETDNYDYDVWLQEDIVGKDHKKAWLEYDDLSQSDITGNFHMTPSCLLDINKSYKRVFDDEKFRNESKASGKNVDRLPLGNILNPLDLGQIKTPVHVQEIILDGDTIWSLK
jgi:hypothetical protein